MRINSVAEVADHARKRFDRLAAAFQEDDSFPARLPPGDGLRQLLEEVFWASISRDEGRPCRFTVAYYGPEVGEANADIAVALDPKPVERGILRRLAAVAFAADAEIAISPVGGDLRIIGLCKRLHLYLESPSVSLMPIEIEVRGPAHIVIRYGIFRILTYANGEVPEPGPNILDTGGPFRRALDYLAISGQLPSKDLRFSLKSLLRQVDRNGHGGLLILSAKKPSGLESVSWPIANDIYSLPDVQRLRAGDLKRYQLPKDDPDRISSSQLRRSQSNLQALERDIFKLSTSLALTDGGVWLDGSLRPRAFGVFARLDPCRQISIASDAAGTHLQDMTFATLGARHRAMVALAGRNHGCPAIAVSVDGGFSAALGVEGREEVLVWHFESWDLDVDDPFDPQYPAMWQDMFSFDPPDASRWQ